MLFAQRNHRRAGADADLAWRHAAFATVADEECPDGSEIGVGGGTDPLAEFAWSEARGSDALAIEKRAIALCYKLSLINNNDHRPAPESAHLPRTERGTRRGESWKTVISCSYFLGSFFGRRNKSSCAGVFRQQRADHIDAGRCVGKRGDQLSDGRNYWLQNVLAFGVHLPKPVATMLAMTRQT